MALGPIGIDSAALPGFARAPPRLAVGSRSEARDQRGGVGRRQRPALAIAAEEAKHRQAPRRFRAGRGIADDHGRSLIGALAAHAPRRRFCPDARTTVLRRVGAGLLNASAKAVSS